MEALADKNELPTSIKSYQHKTLGDLVRRYQSEVISQKKSGSYEALILDAFLWHPICRKSLSQLSSKDFASYRDERLEQIQPASLRRQLKWVYHSLVITGQRRNGKLSKLGKLGIRFVPAPGYAGKDKAEITLGMLKADTNDIYSCKIRTTITVR
jgi:hypothetical protein